MKTRRWFIGAAALFLLLLPAYPARADEPTLPFDYTRLTDDGEHIFVMLTDVAWGEEDPAIRALYSQSGLYALADPDTPLWTVDWYALSVKLSRDGRYLVREGPWPCSLCYGELAVAFYDQGQLLHDYSVADLVLVPPLLPHSVSHYFWRETWEFDAAQNQLYLVTKHGESYRFDITTGETLGGQLASTRRVIFGGGFCVSVIGTMAIVALLVLQARRRRKTPPPAA